MAITQEPLDRSQSNLYHIKYRQSRVQSTNFNMIGQVEVLVFYVPGVFIRHYTVLIMFKRTDIMTDQASHIKLTKAGKFNFYVTLNRCIFIYCASASTRTA